MIKVAVGHNQSVWDLAIQHYGAPEGALQLMLDNPGVINFNDMIPQGSVLFVGEAIDKSIVDYLASKGITPSTAIDISIWVLTTGLWDDSAPWNDNENWID